MINECETSAFFFYLVSLKSIEIPSWKKSEKNARICEKTFIIDVFWNQERR